MQQAIGKILDGRYQVTGVLGEGGFGCVYRTRELNSDTVVAVKILKPEILDTECLARFEREAKVLSLLDHPNICRFSGFGWHEQLPYLAMEYVEGFPLYCLDGRLTPAEVLQLALEICDALAHAHGRGIVHRDLKPTNIMVIDSHNGRHVKLLDFGLSKLIGTQHQKLTNTGFFIGSANYASPEQCLASTVDARSDIYSLGCLLYELLAGKPPFAEVDELVAMHKQVYETAPKLVEQPGKEARRLVRCIEIAMQKVPDERFQNIAELRGTLISDQSAAIFRSKFNKLRNALTARLSRPEIALWPAVLALVGMTAIVVACAAMRVFQAHISQPEKGAPPVVHVTEVIDSARHELNDGDYIQAQSSIEELLRNLRGDKLRSRQEIQATVLLGQILQARSQYAKSLAVFLGAYKLATQTLPVDDPMRDWAQAMLGNSYTLNQEYALAVDCLSANLQVRENSYGKRSWQVAESRFYLADVYTKQGKLKAASDQFKQAYEIYEATIGASDPRTIAALGRYKNTLVELHGSSY